MSNSYESDFPQLGAKQQNPSKSRLGRFSKPTQHFVVHGRSIIEMRKTQTLLTKTKYTRMCRSVENQTECPYGERCNFAHSFDQLRIPECRFGSACRNVTLCEKQNIYKNTGTRTCKYLHADETKENYYKRVESTP